VAAFDWNKFWDQEQPDAPWLSEGARSQVRDALTDGWLVPGASLLDLGCGIGNTSAWLAGKGFRVVGLDVAPSAIARARAAHAGTAGLTFEVADVTRENALHRTFDAILDLGCLHALSPEGHCGYAANVRQWSAPGTRMLLLMRFGAPLFVRETYDSRTDLVNRLFTPDFEIESLAGTNMASSDRHAERPGIMARLRRR